MAVTDDFLAIAPAPLTGVSASKRGAHPRWRVSRQANVGPTLRAQCVHTPHTGYALLPTCEVVTATCAHALGVFFRALGVSLCKVFLRCRDTHWLGVTIFVGWLGCGAEQ